MKRIVIKDHPIYYFIPAGVVMSVLAFYPLFNNFQLSLTNSKGVLTFSNYQRLYNDRLFWNACLNSAKWLALTVTFEIVIGILSAIMLNMGLKGTKAFRTILMIPWMTPVIAVCAIWKWMLNMDFGILSYYFNKAFSSNIIFLGDPKLTIVWLSLVYAWKRSSFVMLMYLSGLQTISEDVYEACVLDGAAWFKQLFYITLPMLFPVIRSVMLISIISSLNQFTIVYNMTGGGPARTTELIQMFIYKNGIQSFDFNYGATGSSIFMLLVLVIALIYVVYTEKIEEGIY